MTSGDATPAPFAGIRRRYLTDDPRAIERFGDPYKPLEPDENIVQFDHPLTPTQFERLGAMVADRPDVQLYVYYFAATDLEFLRHVPNLRRLQVHLYRLEDISGFRFVPELTELNFGKTKKTFSLRFLADLPHLKDLFLGGHKKDLSTIHRLDALTSIAFSGITLPDLSILLPLQRLRRVYNLLGGTRDLDALASLPELEELHLMRITQLSDLGILPKLHNLRKLDLDWMRNVTVLPSFAGLHRLEHVELSVMKGLTDLSPVAAAPALRRLMICDMRQLGVDDFRCFLGHPTLEILWADTGKRSLNQQLKELLPGIAR